jgi:hypothetical protein
MTVTAAWATTRRRCRWSSYHLMRRQSSDDYAVLRAVTPSELQNNAFQTQDKYLQKDTSHAYRVGAYDFAGQLIGYSADKTL